MTWYTVIGLLVAASVVAFIVAAYARHWKWAGFAASPSEPESVRPYKTLWDWLQLLIVPAILILVVALWNAAQTSRDKSQEDDARQATVLTAYLNQMSDLILERDLLSSEVDSPVRAVARSVTLITLRRLGAERKGAVIRFLYESHLLQIPQEQEHNVYLNGADLHGANLAGAQLPGAFLGDVNADYGLVDLGGATLAGANLRGANLKGVILGDADLRNANLSHANLRGAHLEGAKLDDANLRGAHLEDANLRGATGLDLDSYISALPLAERKAFLKSQKASLDLLPSKELAKFNLTPEKLAKLREEASGA